MKIAQEKAAALKIAAEKAAAAHAKLVKEATAYCEAIQVAHEKAVAAYFHKKCQIEESHNAMGPNRCSSSADCYGHRTCSEYNWCEGHGNCPPSKAKLAAEAKAKEIAAAKLAAEKASAAHAEAIKIAQEKATAAAFQKKCMVNEALNSMGPNRCSHNHNC